MYTKMRKEFEANLRRWNEVVETHVNSKYYDVEGFKKGETSLFPIEIEELGEEVKGKSLLHLQCHFGMDTLSWARMGASSVTGVDFSNKAIAKARELSDELGIPANFILSNVLEVDKVIKEQFDIVYTSYGTIIWLDDLKKWARVINHCLKPGGIFYFIDGAPFANLIDENFPDEIRLVGSYFKKEEPYKWVGDGTYADEPGTSTVMKNKVEFEWNHSASEIINALLEEGLILEYIHEFPCSTFRRHPDLVKSDDDKLWRFKTIKVEMPMLMSLRFKKPD